MNDNLSHKRWFTSPFALPTRRGAARHGTVNKLPGRPESKGKQAEHVCREQLQHLHCCPRAGGDRRLPLQKTCTPVGRHVTAMVCLWSREAHGCVEQDGAEHGVLWRGPRGYDAS
jgi:hypothetical protein